MLESASNTTENESGLGSSNGDDSNSEQDEPNPVAETTDGNRSDESTTEQDREDETAIPSNETSNGSDVGTSPIFDVPAHKDNAGKLECKEPGPGIHCRNYQTLFECDDTGERTRVEYCSSGICAEGIGCVVCREGQFSCQGNRVLRCDTSIPLHRWEEIDTCQPRRPEVCDVKTGTCIPTHIVGNDVPTGRYYQYAVLDEEDDPKLQGGGALGSFENRIYTVNYLTDEMGYGIYEIRIFEVELIDSDDDGLREPNQHPDNPENTGPIEERLITFVDSIPIEDGLIKGDGDGELYVTEDTIYYHDSTTTIYAYDIATATGRRVTSHAPAFYGIAINGYDEVNNIWYAGSRSRGVWQYDSATASWGWAFHYPNLAGDHMDGMEVVAQRTIDNEGRITYGIPYIYVTDMTSDFIGQYRLDPFEGWIQENLFQYNDKTGGYVESMGFGALNHFWANGGDFIYELGGGDLAEYVEPIE